MEQNKCKFCGSDIPITTFTRVAGQTINLKSRKCYLCNPYKNGKDSIKHTTRACLKYPEKIKILYECRCKTNKKDHHHFDYKRMFEVYLLCRKCHMAEHQRIEPGYNSNDKYGNFTFANKIKKRWRK